MHTKNKQKIKIKTTKLKRHKTYLLVCRPLSGVSVRNVQQTQHELQPGEIQELLDMTEKYTLQADKFKTVFQTL